MKYQFHTLDVFTTQRFSGNPLAVVLDADGLTTRQMQTITKEFNLSETTFVLKPDNPAHTAKMRIFYPGGEMSFAGHPTIGTSLLLAELRQLDHVTLEVKAGLTPVAMKRQGEANEAILRAPVLPFVVKAKLPTTKQIAAALALQITDIGFGKHEPVFLEGGPRFFMVPVKSATALAKCRVSEPYWSKMFAALKPAIKVDGAFHAAYVYTKGEGADYRARMFDPGGGIPEDPATGSATALLAAQLLKSEGLKDGTHKWQLQQGYEMGRPSDLRLEADVANGKLEAVRLAGSAVRIASGEIDV